MRIIIELFALFFAITTIYRRLIEPFLDGMRNGKKPERQMNNTGMKVNPSSMKKNIHHPDPKEIQDAEFEEIK